MTFQRATARLHAAIVLTAIVLTWAWCPTIEAQGQEGIRPRHIRPLFGQPDPRQSEEETKDGGLSLSGSLFGAYDDDLAVDAGNATPLRPHPQVGGTYSSIGGHLVYDHLSDHFTLRADGATSARYYPDFERITTGRQVANLLTTWSTPVGRRTMFSLGSTARYSEHALPFTSALMPGASTSDEEQVAEPVSSQADFGEEIVESRRRGSFGVEARLARAIGRRQSFGVIVGAQTSVLEDTDRMDSYEAGGVYTSEVGRFGIFRAGYTLQEVSRGIFDYRVHHLSLGGDYRRPLSASRRGFVSFSAGSALLESNARTRLFVTGDATLRYAFHVPWAMVVRYDRTFNFVDEIRGPLLSDGVTTEFDGTLTRRLELTTSVSARRGTVGLSDVDNPYNMLGGRARLRLALYRNAALFAEYLYFHYDFTRGVDFSSGLPSQLDRQTARVGLTVNTRLIR